jgi:hypothetical protein
MARTVDSDLGNRATLLVLLTLLAPTVTLSADQGSGEEKLRLLRLSGKVATVECDVTVQRRNNGWSIESATKRGNLSLTVTARYDKDERLTAASAVLTKPNEKSAVAVDIVEAKARVQRPGKAAQELDAPQGVIVTSAPDWTDALLLCRRYDRAKGGKQELAALWIHPEQEAQRLTLSIERLGGDQIEHEGQKLELSRFAIRLRGNSLYTAWADAKGRMVKLIPGPITADKAPDYELVLDSFEKSATTLRLK